MTTDKPQYPLTARGDMIDRDMIENYLRVLFGRVRYQPSHFINARGIGEKGTDKEGMHQEDCWAQPDLYGDGVDQDDALTHDFATWAWVWAQHNVATYIVPAVLNEARGRAEAVCLFPGVVVDLDSGDTNAKGAHLAQHLGRPTMTVFSGGTTQSGQPKMHLYWIFDEPSADIKRVVDMRHDMAAKAGGDLSLGRGVDANPYGRAHQPIRVPGSVHAKHGVPNLVQLVDNYGPVYDIDILAESIRRMPRAPWVEDAPLLQGNGGTLGFDGFGADKTFTGGGIGDALTAVVHEGGEDKTRWSEFNKVAGLHIRMVRDGKLSIAEAADAVHGWVLSKMEPPWPAARVEKEWRALVNRDEQRSGPLPALAREEKSGAIVTDANAGLAEYAVHRWTGGDVPKRKFLVDGLILDGKPHLLVAEGGAGKTFAMLDLCGKLAGLSADEPAHWLGKRVLGRDGKPGTVVMLTTEDDRDELHIRLAGMDPDGKRFRAGNRFIVVPAVNTPRGPFTFGERDKLTGAVVPSAGWTEFKGWLEAIDDLCLVVVDTLNTTLHGEENSATTVNEYARMLAPVCGRMGAALVVTHHIRKQDSKIPIKTKADMHAAVRGSSALSAAFRAVLGIWHAHNFGGVLQGMGMEPKPGALWRFAVLKANNPEMMDGTGWLLRNGAGMLEDVAERVTQATARWRDQPKAWLLAVIRLAAEAGDPYRKADRSNPYSIAQRRKELPPVLEKLSAKQIDDAVQELIDHGNVVVRNVECRTAAGKIRPAAVLDVKGGALDSRDTPRLDVLQHWSPPSWSEWDFNGATGRVGPKSQQFSIGNADSDGM